MTDIDLDAFAGLASAQEAGLAVAIKTPAGDALGLTIVVAGPDSDRQQAFRRKMVNARLRKRNRDAMTADDLNEEGILGLAASVISWSPDPIMGGKALPCTAENVAAVFRKYRFIFEQVDAAAGDRASFLPS